jgi:hypothetical protein
LSQGGRIRWEALVGGHPVDSFDESVAFLGGGAIAEVTYGGGQGAGMGEVVHESPFDSTVTVAEST